MSLFYIVALFFIINSALVQASTGKLRRTVVADNAGLNNDECSVLCRVTMIDIMFINDTTIYSEHSVTVIPIVNEEESDYDFPFTFTSDFYNEHEDKIEAGTLFVRITNAAFEDDELIIGEDPIVIEEIDDRRLLDHILHRYLQVQQEMTVAIVRLSTIDSSPDSSLADLRKTHFEGDINFPKQYEACSHGKQIFRLVDDGMIDVTLHDRTINEFVNDPLGFITAGMQYMRNELGYETIKGIADRVIFCLAPGTSNFAASAAINHWRVNIDNEWCESISATAHELGHTMGLLHANTADGEYKDLVGYMSSSRKNSTFPRKCFNPANTHYLGWFDDKEIFLDPRNDKDGPQLVKLAGTVEYDRASSTEYVLVNLVDKYFIGYNLQDGPNADTESKQNQVVVNSMAKINGNQAAGTQALAGIDVGQTYKIPNFMGEDDLLWIKVCRKEDGGNGTSSIMVISIAMGKEICNTTESLEEDGQPDGVWTDNAIATSEGYIMAILNYFGGRS